MSKNMGLLRKAVRCYTFHTPIERGKYRLSDLSIKFSPPPPADTPIKTADGRSIVVDPRNESYKYIYFTGWYEPVISQILTSLVRPGSTCLDIGANMGWYTTLFQKFTGERGQVHAFEPVPPTFELLKRNVHLNEPPRNVRVNNIALGDKEKDVELHLFPDLPDGHASIATFDRNDYETYQTRMSILDNYLAENQVGDIDLVKIDVEGSELMLLRGASILFEQENPPILEIEMARSTAVEFNYLPNDLIEYISSKAKYRFYAIDERFGKIQRIDGFAADDIGANVICMPECADHSRLSRWLI